MEADGVLFAVNDLVGNAGITWVENMSFWIRTELFVPEECGLKHAVEGLQDLKVKDFVALFANNAWTANVGGCFDKEVHQHASDFHDDFLIAILWIFETRLDKSVRDVCCHNIAFLMCIDGRGDENAFSGSSRTGYLKLSNRFLELLIERGS